MPTNSNVLPTAASGWTNSNNVLLDDGSNATDSNASKTWNGSSWDFTNTASLYATTFTGIDTGVLTGDRIDGITVEVQFGYLTVPCDAVFVYLCNAGVVLAGSTYRYFTPASSGVQTYTLGGAADLWGLSSMTKTQLTNLQILVIGTKTVAAGTADCACDVIKVSATYTEIRPTTPGFSDQTGIACYTTVYSNTVVVSGVGVGNATTVLCSNPDLYCSADIIWNGTPLAVNGFGVGGTNLLVGVQDGDTLQWRCYMGSTWNRTLTISSSYASGYLVDTFDLTIRAQDNTPAAFSFPASSNALPSTTVSSAYMQVTGIDIDSYIPVNVTNGRFWLWTWSGTAYYWAGPYTTTQYVYNNRYIYVDGTANASPGGTTTVTLDVNGVTANFVITTATDPYCDDFAFTPSTGNAASSTVYSNAVTISGMYGAQTVYLYGTGFITSSFCRKNGGAWQALPISDTTVQGDTWEFKVVTGAGANDAGGASMYVTGTSGTGATFVVANGTADMIPDAFTLTDVTGAARSTIYTSNTITVAGLTAAYSTYLDVNAAGIYCHVVVNGVEYSTTHTFVLQNGDTFAIKLQSSSRSQGVVSARVNFGSTTENFTITTRGSPPPQDF